MSVRTKLAALAIAGLIRDQQASEGPCRGGSAAGPSQAVRKISLVLTPHRSPIMHPSSPGSSPQPVRVRPKPLRHKEPGPCAREEKIRHDVPQVSYADAAQRRLLSHCRGPVSVVKQADLPGWPVLRGVPAG
jgi:hypothetical protein